MTSTGEVASAGELTRHALIEAAARLLTDHRPGSITGRQLADEAGVNYGLVHHYFGGKDALIEAGMDLLRDDFVARYGDGTDTPFLGADGHPFMRATVWRFIDGTGTRGPDERFSIAASMVDAIDARLGSEADDPMRNEARARVIAAISMQVFYGVFGPTLLEATGVGDGQRADVERRLGELYDMITSR